MSLNPYLYTCTYTCIHTHVCILVSVCILHVSIGGFELIFINLFEKCSILTPDIRKQPKTSLESKYTRQIKVWQWSTTRASYVHKFVVKFSGVS